MKRKFNEWLKKILTKWVIANYPFEATTKTHHYFYVLIKKRKIKEWRMYDENHNRVNPQTKQQINA